METIGLNLELQGAGLRLSLFHAPGATPNPEPQDKTLKHQTPETPNPPKFETPHTLP